MTLDFETGQRGQEEEIDQCGDEQGRTPWDGEDDKVRRRDSGHDGSQADEGQQEPAAGEGHGIVSRLISSSAPFATEIVRQPGAGITPNSSLPAGPRTKARGAGQRSL